MKQDLWFPQIDLSSYRHTWNNKDGTTTTMMEENNGKQTRDKSRRQRLSLATYQKTFRLSIALELKQFKLDLQEGTVGESLHTDGMSHTVHN